MAAPFRKKRLSQAARRDGFINRQPFRAILQVFGASLFYFTIIYVKIKKKRKKGGMIL
jgi:hypothetical protein